MSIVKEQRASFATLTFQYFAESFDGGKGAFEMRHSFLYFVGTPFQIFEREFLIHLRTVYASCPRKLAPPLNVNPPQNMELVIVNTYDLMWK